MTSPANGSAYPTARTAPSNPAPKKGARNAAPEQPLVAADAGLPAPIDAPAANTANTPGLLATAKAHPFLSVAALIGGVAALGLLANPAGRRLALAAAPGAWAWWQQRKKA